MSRPLLTTQRNTSNQAISESKSYLADAWVDVIFSSLSVVLALCAQFISISYLFFFLNCRKGRKNCISSSKIGSKLINLGRKTIISEKFTHDVTRTIRQIKPGVKITQYFIFTIIEFFNVKFIQKNL